MLQDRQSVVAKVIVSRNPQMDSKARAKWWEQRGEDAELTYTFPSWRRALQKVLQTMDCRAWKVALGKPRLILLCRIELGVHVIKRRRRRSNPSSTLYESSLSRSIVKKKQNHDEKRLNDHETVVRVSKKYVSQRNRVVLAIACSERYSTPSQKTLASEDHERTTCYSPEDPRIKALFH